MARTPSYRSIRFALVALFAAGGLLLWGELAPVDGYVGFRVPPTIRSADGSVRREHLRKLTVVVRDSEGQIVARSEQQLENGMTSPVTPPLSMRLPRGDYIALATFTSRSGETVSLTGSLKLNEDGYHRVDLGKPH